VERALDEDEFDLLTPRELEILKLIAEAKIV
jgi:DNA-binding NarL/FixJ family response regulator